MCPYFLSKKGCNPMIPYVSARFKSVQKACFQLIQRHKKTLEISYYCKGQNALENGLNLAFSFLLFQYCFDQYETTIYKCFLTSLLSTF